MVAPYLFSFITLLLAVFDTQTLDPSKHTPKGFAPTLKELLNEATPHLSNATC